MTIISNISAKVDARCQGISREGKQNSLKVKQPAFKGYVSTYRLRQELSKKLLANKSGLAQKLNKIKIGEASNISINALGTAVVAPIFIAYNPLSKTDEQTKNQNTYKCHNSHH